MFTAAESRKFNEDCKIIWWEAKKKRPDLCHVVESKLRGRGYGDHIEPRRTAARLTILKEEDPQFIDTLWRSVRGESSPANLFDLFDKWNGVIVNPRGHSGGNFKNL